MRARHASVPARARRSRAYDGRHGPLPRARRHTTAAATGGHPLLYRQCRSGGYVCAGWLVRRSNGDFVHGTCLRVCRDVLCLHTHAHTRTHTRASTRTQASRGKHLREEVLPVIPLDRLMLETDAPFMFPTQGNRSRCEPHHTVVVCEKVAEVLGVDFEVVAASTTANARAVFRLDHHKRANAQKS
mmetsp:Transcript_14838/g.26316  ORF Transcript_14838/g.26316 Transcript_14838/m.26316 type:complete len:186 (-) Transcript_14838:30-587(-)